MQQIAELERRITAALERIGTGVDGLRGGARGGEADELAPLRDALDEERMANAQLNERLKVVKAKETQAQSRLSGQVDQLTRQLDAGGLEILRMKKTVIQLREELRRLREAAEQGLSDPHLINRALQAELDALRATRAAETFEMEEILVALNPLLTEEAEENA